LGLKGKFGVVTTGISVDLLHIHLQSQNDINSTKLNARLALRQRAVLFKANISANKISLSQGQSYTAFSFCIALALRKANFVSRNIGLK